MKIRRVHTFERSNTYCGINLNELGIDRFLGVIYQEIRRKTKKISDSNLTARESRRKLHFWMAAFHRILLQTPEYRNVQENSTI